MTFLNSEYILKTDNTALSVTTDEVNNHLKTSIADITANTYISLLIKAVEKFGEDFTKREFLTKTFTNYRSAWASEYEIRKSKLQSIVSVNYLDSDGNTQTVNSSNYLTTQSNGFSYLKFISTYSFPTLYAESKQPVIIELTAGYGATNTSIPKDIKEAILAHLARLYGNRGDCPMEGSDFDNFLAQALPVTSRLIYSQKRIIDIKI